MNKEQKAAVVEEVADTDQGGRGDLRRRLPRAFRCRRRPSCATQLTDADATLPGRQEPPYQAVRSTRRAPRVAQGIPRGPHGVHVRPNGDAALAAKAHRASSQGHRRPRVQGRPDGRRADHGRPAQATSPSFPARDVSTASSSGIVASPITALVRGLGSMSSRPRGRARPDSPRAGLGWRRGSGSQEAPAAEEAAAEDAEAPGRGGRRLRPRRKRPGRGVRRPPRSRLPKLRRRRRLRKHPQRKRHRPRRSRPPRPSPPPRPRPLKRLQGMPPRRPPRRLRLTKPRRTSNGEGHHRGVDRGAQGHFGARALRAHQGARGGVRRVGHGGRGCGPGGRRRWRRRRGRGGVAPPSTSC